MRERERGSEGEEGDKEMKRVGGEREGKKKERGGWRGIKKEIGRGRRKREREGWGEKEKTNKLERNLDTL